VEFSRRTQWDLQETQWALELARIRASGARIFDLTASNPTHCGFRYDASSILSPLACTQALSYNPDPRGSLTARQAISHYYAGQGIEVDPSSLLLTTSTSEAYSFLFRLLADPGDVVLIAQPSYPLFDFLAQLDDISLTPYELLYDHGWQIDLDGLRELLRSTARSGTRTKAIAVVHPNNPTGHFTRRKERAELEAICREYAMALIVDEVFLDYWFSAPAESFAAGEHDVLTFVLSGISKIAALPQMKAAWIASFGAKHQLEEAQARLDVIADTFLSVNAPVACALPAWLETRHGLQRQIRERTGHNLAVLDGLLKRGNGLPKGQGPLRRGQTKRDGTTVTRLELEAGWYVVLRVPAVSSGEDMALDLLTRRGIAVHPGGFFGFPQAGWLVVSLLPPEEEFAEGIRSLLRHFS
jgi:alanine-synthesizing transaminase